MRLGLTVRDKGPLGVTWYRGAALVTLMAVAMASGRGVSETGVSETYPFLFVFSPFHAARVPFVPAVPFRYARLYVPVFADALLASFCFKSVTIK